MRRRTLQKLHHVAYRCRDAQETVEFYAVGEGAALRGEVDLIHIFFACGRWQLHRVLRPSQLAADAGRSEHAELGQPHRLRGGQHGRAAGTQASPGSGGRRRAGTEGPQLLPVDLLLRPEWDPAGDDCAHRGPGELDAAEGQLAVWNGRKQRKYDVPA